jgi:methionyl aminopeptidase
MHEDPHVANAGRAGRGLVLRPGLTLALEPWWSATSSEIFTDPDGWTLRFQDGSRGSHSEHTIAITEDGARVLTRVE